MGILYIEHQFSNGIPNRVSFDLLHMRRKIGLESGTLVTVREPTRLGAFLGRKSAVHIEMVMKGPITPAGALERLAHEQEVALGILGQHCVQSTISSLQR